MVLSKRKLEANQRNAQLAKGPHDTSLTRFNALKHGILSKQVLIRGGKGAEDPEEFQQFSDAMREDWAPAGITEELLVEDLIGIEWRKRRVLAYESALISKQWDGAVEDWEQQHPFVRAHKQWTAEQSPKSTPEQRLKSTAEPSGKLTVEQLFKKMEGDQPGNSTRKHDLGLAVTHSTHQLMPMAPRPIPHHRRHLGLLFQSVHRSPYHLSLHRVYPGPMERSLSAIHHQKQISPLIDQLEALAHLHTPASPDSTHHAPQSYPHLIGEAQGRLGCHPGLCQRLPKPPFFQEACCS